MGIMGLVRAGPDELVFDGQLVGQTCKDFEGALNLLRESDVEVPTVDLSRVTYISSTAIGLLVALWIDTLDQGRWFDLLASDRVWDVLEKIGAVCVFRRPDGAPLVKEVH